MSKPNQRNNWLTEEDWRRVQSQVPIICVDVIPFRALPEQAPEIGLILRDTPHEGRRWCLVGGRVLLNEPLLGAAQRQIHETLGPGVDIVLPAATPPIFIAEYLSERFDCALFDPRQHSVALTYFAGVSGEIRAQGEAFDFKWYSVAALPASSAFGFGQDTVLKECLNRAGDSRSLPLTDPLR